MQKYTKKQVIEERISFKPMSKEQFDKLFEHFGFEKSFLIARCNYKNDYYYRFYLDKHIPNSKCFSRNCSYLHDTNTSICSTKEISFEEFDFEEEIIYTLKDLSEGKVALKYNNDLINLNRILQYCFVDGSIAKGIRKFYLKSNFCGWKWFGTDNVNVPHQDLSIFLKELNQIQNNMENKKLIGYNFKPEYKTKRVSLAVYRHDNNDFEKIYRGGYNFTHNSDTCQIIKELGTLDLWCYPVYEEEKKEKTIRMGGENGFDVIITKESITHAGKDNITNFVKELVQFFLNTKFANFNAYVDLNKIEFSKTGCQNTRTTLLEWKNVLDIYNEFQK